jgi:hypothetical protein
MFTYDQILRALRAEGLKVVEVPGSRGRCRCHSGPHSNGGPLVRAFAPTGDVMVHITAGGLGGRSPLQYIADIINGDPSTPFKSQFVTDPEGVVYLNGAGRANHAGTCGSRAVAASRNQQLSTEGYQGNLRGSDADGNTVWYGIENIAATSMTTAQRAASVRICAALSRLARRTGRGSIGHGEASNNRSYADPNLDMGAFRRDVIARVKAGPSGARENGFLMALTDKQQDKIADQLDLLVDIAKDLAVGAAGKRHDGPGGAMLREIRNNVRAIRKETPQVDVQVDAKAIADAILDQLPDDLASQVVAELGVALTEKRVAQ